MKLDDPVDQRSRSGCAKQFVAQGPEVAAGIVAQQLVELLPHALDARPEFAANRLRVFSGRAGANKVGDVQPNAGRGGVEQRKLGVGGQPRILDRLPEPGQRSEEHTSELQSLMRISDAVICLKK